MTAMMQISKFTRIDFVGFDQHELNDLARNFGPIRKSFRNASIKTE